MVFTSSSASSALAIPRSKSSLDTWPKFYLIEVPKRVAFTDLECRQKNMENEEDNPFRPGSELSREADIIVNLIKEGKPITPTGDIVAATSANNSNVVAANNNSNSQTPQKQKDEILTKQQTHLVSKNHDDKDGPINKIHNKSNNNNNNMEPGQIEIQHGIIVANNVDNNMTTVEQINLKKKRKCCSLI